MLFSIIDCPPISIFSRVGNFLSICLNYKRITRLEDIFSGASRCLRGWCLRWLPSWFNFRHFARGGVRVHYSQERRKESSLDKWDVLSGITTFYLSSDYNGEGVRLSRGIKRSRWYALPSDQRQTICTVMVQVSRAVVFHESFRSRNGSLK